MSLTESLLIGFRVIAPLFLYMLTGILLRVTRILDRSFFPLLNQIVYYAAIPLVCMQAIMKGSGPNPSGASVLLYNLVFSVILIGISCWIIPKLEPENARRGVLIQSMFRCNDALFGLAVAISLFSTVPLMSLSIAIVVPVFNIFSVLILSHLSGKEVDKRKSFLQIVRNPIIVGCLAGIIFSILKIRHFPAILDTAINGLAGLGTPLAFIALGGMLSLHSLQKNRKAIAIVTISRLIIIPAIAVSIAILIGYRSEALGVVYLVYGSPIATATLPIAVAFSADDTLQAELIASTSAFSIVSAFIFITVLSRFGLL